MQQLDIDPDLTSITFQSTSTNDTSAYIAIDDVMLRRGQCPDARTSFIKVNPIILFLSDTFMCIVNLQQLKVQWLMTQIRMTESCGDSKKYTGLSSWRWQVRSSSSFSSSSAQSASVIGVVARRRRRTAIRTASTFLLRRTEVKATEVHARSATSTRTRAERETLETHQLSTPPKPCPAYC